MSCTYVGRDLFIYGTLLIHVWNMTHSYVAHESSICGTWLIYRAVCTRCCWQCDMCCVCVCVCVCVACPIHIWNMSHSYVGHDSFVRQSAREIASRVRMVCVPWLVHTCLRCGCCATSQGHGSSIYVGPISMRDQTYLYEGPDLFTYVTLLIHRAMLLNVGLCCIYSCIYMCDMTHLYVGVA